MFRILKPDIPRSFQTRIYSGLRSTDLVNRFVQLLYDVKFVKSNLGIFEMARRSFDVSRRHIHRDVSDLFTARVMVFEFFRKTGNRALVFSRRHIYDFTFEHIDEYADVFVSLARRGLVYSDVCYIGDEAFGCEHGDLSKKAGSLIICGIKNSKAERYANENSFIFKELKE